MNGEKIKVIGVWINSFGVVDKLCGDWIILIIKQKEQFRGGNEFELNQSLFHYNKNR